MLSLQVECKKRKNMFTKDIYIERRNKLRQQIKHGIAVFLTNNEAPMNYPSNTYRYRQDSNFIYFFGLQMPGMVGVIDFDEDKDFIFGDDFTIDDIIGKSVIIHAQGDDFMTQPSGNPGKAIACGDIRRTY